MEGRTAVRPSGITPDFHAAFKQTWYKMLCYLVRNPRQVLTNQAILDEVWGQEYRNSNGLVKAHVQRLRKKLKDNLQDPRLIITERGRGYRFAGAS